MTHARLPWTPVQFYGGSDMRMNLSSPSTVLAPLGTSWSRPGVQHWNSSDEGITIHTHLCSHVQYRPRASYKNSQSVGWLTVFWLGGCMVDSILVHKETQSAESC